MLLLPMYGRMGNLFLVFIRGQNKKQWGFDADKNVKEISTSTEDLIKEFLNYKWR